jgi:hypothetical protein
MHHLDDDSKPEPTGKHVQAQRVYYEMRQRHDVAKRTASEAYKAMKAAEAELVESMLEAGISRLDYMNDGTKLHFRGIVNISITEENEPAIREWLIKNYGDDNPFMLERLSKKSVSEQIKKDMEAGELHETDLPEELKFSQIPGISVTGWNDRHND